jgi:hypothetical protein
MPDSTPPHEQSERVPDGGAAPREDYFTREDRETLARQGAAMAREAYVHLNSGREPEFFPEARAIRAACARLTGSAWSCKCEITDLANRPCNTAVGLAARGAA